MINFLRMQMLIYNSFTGAVIELETCLDNIFQITVPAIEDALHYYIGHT
ncbi:MAG: hypothetical protein SOR57_11170 [Parabacteroides sp.]|nr:hypothetical protein [Parabacteroides sp.]